jgi:hypothetical protein
MNYRREVKRALKHRDDHINRIVVVFVGVSVATQNRISMQFNESNLSVTGARVFVCALLSARRKNPESVLDTVVVELEREGARVVGRMLQRRGVSRSRFPGGAAKMDKPLTQRGLFSSGKLKELASMTKSSGAELLIIHNAITNGQRNVLADLTSCRVYSLCIARP